MTLVFIALIVIIVAYLIEGNWEDIKLLFKSEQKKKQERERESQLWQEAIHENCKKGREERVEGRPIPKTFLPKEKWISISDSGECREVPNPFLTPKKPRKQEDSK